MNDDFDGHVLNNHVVQYLGDDKLAANDIRQTTVDYLFYFFHKDVNRHLSGRHNSPEELQY